ncbi:hypothetical protein MCW82_07200 [Azospirillum doebereinerae]|uniref:hypothetical protein n=1 Tax=Azospirillum doebereinerae TaxID=92933 RepID=UPI001EE5C9A5|nr:hypothetical protein [Azospirillum doebereinerae]MCG5239554.1 hypothetical protein [Azospirillum doebereinerae]
MLRMTHDDDGMNRYREALVAACAELQASGLVNSMYDWCKKAGLKSDATVRNFMNGRSRSLSIETYATLAAFAKRPIASLLGEVAPQTERERLILRGFRAAPESGKVAIEAQAQRELGDQ